MDLSPIDGSTRLYAILGDPIAPVRSPQVFNAMFARQSIPAAMVALHVTAADFDVAWAGLRAMRNVEGVVFTMPHKAAAARAVESIGETARRLGMVNTARRERDGRWTGDMFDGRGFVHGLRAQGHAVAGRRVALLGLGGAGSAIALALAEAGVASLTLDDAEAARRDSVIALLARLAPQVPVRVGRPGDGDCDLAVNATPLGLAPDDPLPFDPARLPAATLVADVINKPAMTPLLVRAADTGHRVHTGVHLHTGQAILAARFLGFDLEA